jgi:hypothetical protein
MESTYSRFIFFPYEISDKQPVLSFLPPMDSNLSPPMKGKIGCIPSKDRMFGNLPLKDCLFAI